MESFPRTVSELIEFDGQRFYQWQAAAHESMVLADPDRYSRCYDAAADGCDGSTHAEHIDDMREYASDLASEFSRTIDNEAESDDQAAEWENALDDARNALESDFDRLEKWHADNGSLDSQVG